MQMVSLCCQLVLQTTQFWCVRGLPTSFLSAKSIRNCMKILVKIHFAILFRSNLLSEHGFADPSAT